MSVLARLRSPEAVSENFTAWIRQVALILTAHAGLVVMVALVAGWLWPSQEPAPVIVRTPVDPFARQYVYFFAILPAFAGTLAAVLIGVAGPVGGVAPLIVLSGLAVVMAAGDSIQLSRQHIVIAAWFGFLLIPPIMTVAALYAAPWFNIDLKVTQPARAIARFFAESFERRIGAPLQIVTGEPRTAALVAMGAPSRPSLYLNAAPQRSPWVTPDAIRAKGAIVVWPTTDATGTPPDYIKQSFPDLVPEVPPRAFPRVPQGRLPLMRIGWGVLRPQPPQPPQPAPVAPAAPPPATPEPAPVTPDPAPPEPRRPHPRRILIALSDSLRPRAPCRGTASTRRRCSRARSATARRCRSA